MEIVNVTYAGQGKVEQDYSSKDQVLIDFNYINTTFGDSVDRVEFFVYDANENLVDAEYDFKGYTPYQSINSETNKYNKIIIDPIADSKSRGFNRGSYNVQYNFQKNLFNSSDALRYWIKEISPSRKELKLSSQVISDNNIITGQNQYQAYVSLKNYYSDFYLNFGNNEQVIAINSAVITDDTGTYLLIKLYEPLPFDYDLKTQLWIVDRISESVSYDVEIQIQADVVSDINSLRGPNFNVTVNQKNTQTTPYYSYTSLISSPITSSYRQLASYYQDKGISINVDYSNFENFIHFSSAVERVNNFVYKIGLIETYTSQIAQQSTIVGSNNLTTVSSSITVLQKSISNIIENFDTYEYYLYYVSESFAWPKSTATKPYLLYSVTSSQASNWLGSETTFPSQYTSSVLYSASFYDDTNKDLLRGSIPQYILDDQNNQPYTTFVDMMGQHFDNIWIYYKDVSNRYNATNDPKTGISLDVVSDALVGLGMEIYTNTNVSNNVYYDLFGYNQDGSLLPPTGSEVITNYISSSLDTIGAKQLQQEIYKRIYHNLPYLLKTRGTQRGIKALISIYGIPDSILKVNEFGGFNRYEKDGITEINNDKITIVDPIQELSSSLLSAYSTIQYYNTDNRTNSTNIEVGFSTSDIINRNITSSLGYFNIDNLIGNPIDQYSSSYSSLDQLKNSYFSSYTQPHSISEYIRLIKYYNNSLFKTIKDFVPARANLSTGIIVKSHMLERNKYARHEPIVTFENISQSIDILTLSGEPGNLISGSTEWNIDRITPVGIVPFTSSQGVEKLTGEFGGSTIVVTDLNSISDQSENSNNPSASIGKISVNYGALYQNISGSVRSQKYFDLDYTSNQLTPVNLNIITQSISNSLDNNYNTYTNPNNPYAQLQDYNYATRHFTDPRYYGSKTTSSTYNVYTVGDSSYGKTAAIDKIKPEFAYLVDIFSSSFQLPKRANAQIKYIIDRNQNALDLTKANTNIFFTQNIFKTGETVNVSLFRYDPIRPYIQKLTNNSNFTIYEGGFRYSPLLFNISGNESMIYNLNEPSSSVTTVDVPSYEIIDSGNANWWSTITAGPVAVPNAFQTLIPITASVPGTFPSATTLQTRISITLTNTSRAVVPSNYDTYETVTTIAAGSTGPIRSTLYMPSYYQGLWLNGDSVSVSINFQETYNPIGGSTTSTKYFTTVTDLAESNNWYAVDSRNIKLSISQSLLYNNIIFSGSYSGIDTPVFTMFGSQMDMIRLYNSSSQWSQQSEYRINYMYELSDSTGSFWVINLDRDLNPSDTEGTIPGQIKKYMWLKRLPDETNVILNYNLDTPITQDGILFPQYVDENLKNESGNIVKALKAQNLIVSDTNTLIYE